MAERATTAKAKSDRSLTARARPRPSRERIAEAALALLDREGLEGLTMRRVAAEAGLPTATIYGYFRDKDELVDAVIDLGASRSPLPETSGPWHAQLRDLMRWLRRGLVRHPDLVKVRLERPILSLGALRLTERGVGVLLEAGFSRAEAARAYQMLFVFTFGSAAFGPHGDPDEHQRKVRATYTLLPPEEYPVLSSSIAEAAAAMSGEEQFEYALERLLDGLESSLRRHQGRARR
jgi:TetR/AcrR family transcriptional regulator, tetracycline repressor protein